VARHTRQPPPFGPAPVAVHDDGDVFRQPRRVDGLRQFPVAIFRPQRFQKGLHGKP